MVNSEKISNFAIANEGAPRLKYNPGNAWNDVGVGVNDQRKDAGVVDRDGLENRCTLTGTQGSNPCLSADIKIETH